MSFEGEGGIRREASKNTTKPADCRQLCSRLYKPATPALLKSVITVGCLNGVPRGTALEQVHLQASFRHQGAWLCQTMHAMSHRADLALKIHHRCHAVVLVPLRTRYPRRTRYKPQISKLLKE